MSFKAYLDNIEAKTGVSPDEFVELAREKGLFGPDTKATPILEWLRDDYNLGRGHGMALVRYFKLVRERDASLSRIPGESTT